MATFEGYNRRIDGINACMKEYGIASLEEARELCLAKGFDPDAIVKSDQPIAALKGSFVDAAQTFGQLDDRNGTFRKRLFANGFNAVGQHNDVQRLIAVKSIGLHFLERSRQGHDAIGKSAGSDHTQKCSKYNSESFTHGFFSFPS